MRGSLSGIYEFGPFHLTPGLGLSRGGDFVPLAPKELALLEALVRRDGEVATHADLREEIWPGQDVSYHSLTRCAYGLRRALAPDRKAYVATVPRRGYRLTVPVRRRARTATRSVVERSIATTPKAYATYLEGLRRATDPSPKSLVHAIELYELAHRLDPRYTVPLGAIADIRMYQAARGYLPPGEATRLLREVCDRALAIEPDLVSAIAALGWVDGVATLRFDTALDLLDRALTLDPHYSRGHNYRGWVLRTAGRLEESVAAMKVAAEHDPYSLVSQHSLAFSLFYAGRCDEALELLDHMARERRAIDVTWGYMGLMAAWAGRHGEAVPAARRAAEMSGGDPTITSVLGYALACAGKREQARRTAGELRAAVLPRAVRTHLAMVYVAIGDDDEAISLLREAWEERCVWIGAAPYDPRLRALGDHPFLRSLRQGEAG